MPLRFDANKKRQTEMAEKVVRGWDWERLQGSNSGNLAKASGLSEVEAERIILAERKRRAR